MKTHIKKISVLFTVLVSMAFFPLLVNAQRWGSGPVIVYDDRDGTGNEHSFNVGTYRNDRNEFGSLRNDSASSVTVSPGYRVRFCENEGGGRGSGRCEEFGPGNHNLRYPDRASYIRVTGPSGQNWGGGWGGGQGSGQYGVTVYEDRDYRGRSQGFGVGRYMAAGGRFGALRNDSASSIVVARGFRVRLCEHEGSGYGDGNCEEYTEGNYNLRYNDDASYVEVLRVGGWGGGWPRPGGPDGDPPFGGIDTGNAPVIVYSERNQQGGDRQLLGVGTYRNDRGELGQIKNDNATSVSVARGYRVRFCDSEGGGYGVGQCEEFGPGNHNLRYNDRASWIRVWRSGR